MDKKIQLSILAVFVTAALLGSIMVVSDNTAFATKKHKSNDADQAIEEDQSTGQFSECASNNDTTASCNNVALSLNLNDGNNALGQR